MANWPDPRQDYRLISDVVAEMTEKIIAEKMDAALTSMEERGTANPQDVRMQCIELVMKEGKSFFIDGDPVQRADVLAQYVLTGKKPGEA